MATKEYWNDLSLQEKLICNKCKNIDPDSPIFCRVIKIFYDITYGMNNASQATPLIRQAPGNCPNELNKS